jgi:hypothetical protein
MPRRLAALLTVAISLLAAPAARADWFASEAIDGPSADIVELGGVDLARDGNGGLVYLKRDGGATHAFLSRHLGGFWQPPERIDAGISAAASDVAVAAADDSRLAVVWIAGNRVYGRFVPSGAGVPLTPPQELLVADGPVTGLALDMGINGTAYAAVSAPGPAGPDVRALRLEDYTWSAVPAPLDVEPSRSAGTGAGRPDVAVSAEGNAVVTWGEAGAVFARRVTGLSLSLAPQLVSLPEGPGDSPDVAIEDDGSFAWVAFRQTLPGDTQTLARRLLGSLFEPPERLWGRSDPRVAINGRGVGSAVSGDGASVIGTPLVNDHFGGGARMDAGGGDTARVAVSERRDEALVWRQGDGAVFGRYHSDGKPFGPPVALASGQLGPVPAGGLDVATSRAGDVAVAMLQGPAAARYVAAAVWDRPPSPPWISTATRFQRRKRPTLRWRPGLELWGSPTFRVIVDGRELGSSQTAQLRPARKIREGAHRLRIVAVDRRGQSAASRERYIRIDTRAPRVRLRVEGARRAGAALRISARASDGRGSGIKYVELDFGDRSRRVRRASAVHRYRGGRFRLTAKAVDMVGNVARRRVTLRIRR